MERFKKIFIVSMMFVTVLSMSIIVAPEVGATASAGDLIKMSGLSSVYYLAADGKRYVFPNESTYFSWYGDFSGVVTIPQSELESYPLGANVTVRPGTKLVKITTNPKVYAVTAGGNLLAIPDETTAATLYGANWAKRVIDVSDAFFTNYKISSGTAVATAYPAGSLVKFGTSADVFYINADGTASKIASEAALTANRFKMADVITATIAKPTEGAQISGVVGTLTDTSSGAGGTANAGTGITVALASDTPASATVITNTAATGNGQANVNFTKVNFTAAADGDVKITNLKFKRTGISADADVESLYLYDGATRLTDESSISSNVVTFNNVNGLFTVAKGTTKSITLKGDMLYSATSGKTIGFTLVAATDVTTNGAAVSGSFPMAGNLMSTANATDLGKLIVTNTSPATAQTIDPDTKEAEVAKFKLVGSEQALSVEKLVFTEIGSVQTDDLTNFKLLDPSGTVIGTAASMNSSYEVIFDLSAAPYAMAKGVTKILSLRADIAKGSTRTFYFSVQNKQDIVVKDTSYNVYVQPYQAGSFTVAAPDDSTSIFTINSGSLSINRTTTAPSGNITLDGSNVIVGEWDFRASGEDMKVKDLTVIASSSAPSLSVWGLDNAKVYVDGAQVGSTKDITAAGIASWGFGSSFVVKAGTTAKVQVLADIKNTASASYTNGETVLVSVKTVASDVQKMSSLGYQAAIAATNGTAAALTISAAALSVSKYSGFGNQTVIAGTNGVKMGSFVMTAGSAEGVSVSSITVGLSANEYATVTNMYLKDNATGATIGEAKNSPGLSNIYSLSPNIILAANGSKTIDLYANVKSGSNAGAWIAEINASGSGVVTGGSVSSVIADQAIQTMTVASTGTLTVANGSMPDSAIVLAGSTGNYVAEYQFSAANEGFTVSELKLKVGYGFATSTSAVSLSYVDKNGVTQTGAATTFITGTEPDATATFSGLTMYIPANSDATLKVNISLTSIASGAASGATSKVYLDFNEGFKATGDSGTAVTTPDSSTADFASNDFYVRKSKPTFAKQTLTGAPTTGNPLFKFTVVADGAGNIEIKQLGFTVTTNSVTVTDLYLYKPSSSTQITDSTNLGNTTVTSGSVSLIVGSDHDSDVLTIGTTAETYEVRGTVTGYDASNADSMTIKFAVDTSDPGKGTAQAKGADHTTTANGYNIWSDRSASGHTTATADWTNGYLLKDMGSIQQLP